MKTIIFSEGMAYQLFSVSPIELAKVAIIWFYFRMPITQDILQSKKRKLGDMLSENTKQIFQICVNKQRLNLRRHI